MQKQIDTILTTLHFDNDSMSDLKFRLAKRKKKRDRLKRLKSNLKIIKSQQKDEIREINTKIDTWQNTLKENILKQKRVILFIHLVNNYVFIINCIFILG